MSGSLFPFVWILLASYRICWMQSRSQLVAHLASDGECRTQLQDSREGLHYTLQLGMCLIYFTDNFTPGDIACVGRPEG